MQVNQCGEGDLRCANVHSHAGAGIQHPSRNDDDHAGRRFDMHNGTACPLLVELPTYAAAVQRVPAIVNHHLWPDMGRMTQ
jgi:hypothetical protein